MVICLLLAIAFTAVESKRRRRRYRRKTREGKGASKTEGCSQNSPPLVARVNEINEVYIKTFCNDGDGKDKTQMSDDDKECCWKEGNEPAKSRRKSTLARRTKLDECAADAVLEDGDGTDDATNCADGKVHKIKDDKDGKTCCKKNAPEEEAQGEAKDKGTGRRRRSRRRRAYRLK